MGSLGKICVGFRVFGVLGLLKDWGLGRLGIFAFGV